jgi:hypothetical protein
LIYSEKPRANQSSIYSGAYKKQMSEDEKRKTLNEIEMQQTEFGEKKSK